ncbi:MAG: ThiF family adenylyltransferase [Vampirovibrionia bacterium]
MSENIDLTHIYHRNKLLWGANAQDSLWEKHVAIIGLGGVGSYAVEAVARSGVGVISILDFDTVDITNINRQLIATTKTIKKPKTEIMAKRISEINPEIKLNIHNVFYDSAYNEKLFNTKIDYVIDAIDSINSKLDLIEYCITNNIQIVSSLGTGNRLDPTQLYFTDIEGSKGNLCPFGKKVRLSLKKRGIEKGLTILTSKEPPIKPDHTINPDITDNKKPPGSTAFVPPAAGLCLASYVIKKLITD